MKTDVVVDGVHHEIQMDDVDGSFEEVECRVRAKVVEELGEEANVEEITLLIN